MIAAISLMRRRPDISVAQFREHWLDPHGVMTAELPGLQRYWQSHCIDGPATNTLARELAILGFPQLWFDSYDARRLAYTSPRIAECNVDSESFVGAVKRLVTVPREVVRPHRVTTAAKAILLAIGSPDRGWEAEIAERALAEPAVVNFIGHRILEQAAAPQSRIAELKIEVAGIAEVTFASRHALELAAGRLAGFGDDGRRVAVYMVDDYGVRVATEQVY